ncbi:MAG: glycosyltransferase family 39 protein [Thermodesulfobacteriota bacterium]
MKLNAESRELSLIALVSIIWTFVVAYTAYVVLENKYPDTIISIWNVWDTPHYIDIARYGYTSSTADDRYLFIVFFPLYPYLVKIFSLIFRDYLLAALLVSNLSYAGAVFYFFKLVRLDYESEDAFRSVIYLSIFPTAYFFHAAYTESLFILLTIASFYYARKERWALSGLFGMLASATRITGIILLPVLVIEYLNQKGFKLNQVRRNILWISIIPLGLAVYLALNYITFGDPLKFLEFQNKHWAKHFDFLYRGFLVALDGIVLSKPRDSIMTGWGELVFAVMTLAIIVYSFFRIRLSYCLYALATWLVVTSTSFWLSVPRYTLSMFPIFIALSLLGRRREVNYLLIFLSLTLYMLFLVQFIRFGWAF